MDLLNISYKIIFYEEKGCTISTRNKRKKKYKSKIKHSVKIDCTANQYICMRKDEN